MKERILGLDVGDMYATENLQVVYCREHVPEGVLCIEVEGRIILQSLTPKPEISPNRNMTIKLLPR